MKSKIEPMDFLKKYGPLIMVIIIFASALWLRSFPARFSEIQALDPFFFYRMGLEVMDNNWQLGIDEMRYHPDGVDTANNHFLMPIYLPAVIYSLFVGIGLNMSYLHFAIMWPAVLGALAIIPMYLLGKELFNSRKAGMFAAFFLATIPAFITRTSAGFFEKEPIAGVFMLTSMYLFVRAFKRGSLLSGIMGGVSLAVVSFSWGGVQYIYLLFGGFLGLIFLANVAVLILDYMFTGFGDLQKSLSKYMGMDMIKAYVPLMLIGILVHQIMARHVPLTHISVLISFVVMGILLTRFGVERFNLVRKDQLPYVIPVTLMVILAGGLMGSMFNDTMAAKVSEFSNLVTFSRGTIDSTVAENAPGNWGNIASTTGTGFASSTLPQLNAISPYLAVYFFMFIGAGLIIYRFFRTKDWMVLFALVWLLSGIFGVFYYVRLVFLVGPPAALAAGFFMSWVVDRLSRTKYMDKFWKAKDIRGRINPVSILLVVFVGLVLTVNFASAYAYSLNLGPSVCFPRYNSDNPFDVVPCVTIDEEGNEVLSANQPWYEAFTYLAEETPEDSSVLSWWDFGYWFQSRGQRPSIADGGHTGGSYVYTDYHVAEWYVDDSANWGNHEEWLEDRDVDYILMDYTLPGKYGAISKIASRGEEVVGMLQFTQQGMEPRGNESVYIFRNGQYEIWLPLTPDGSLSGTPMFLVSQNGQYVQKSYINDVCTQNNGIIKAGEETPSIPGCVSVSSLGIYYIPPEAEHSVFTNLMFMEGIGLPVEKVFDNQLVKIYKVNRGTEE